MKFSKFLSAIESKHDSIEQLKGLLFELENEIKFVDENHRMCKTAVQERYARIANRVIKDLRFDAEDFAPDQED